MAKPKTAPRTENRYVVFLGDRAVWESTGTECLFLNDGVISFRTKEAGGFTGIIAAFAPNSWSGVYWTDIEFAELA